MNFEITRKEKEKKMRNLIFLFLILNFILYSSQEITSNDPLVNI